jgi:PAS domain S-box-containing protein
MTGTTDFLDGGSDMGELVAVYPWGDTRLGPPADWPQSLKTTVGIMLRSPVPMVLLWGPEGRMIYNDAYSVFAGGRHPRLLGSKVLEGWPEVADFNANVMRVGMAGGTLSYRDQELTLHRHGVPEQVWMNLDYSPVIDETGNPGGVLAIVVETTERVLAERRIAEESDRLRAMFQQAPGFMAVLHGPDHRFEIANASYIQLVGSRDDLVGRTAREALPEVHGQGYFELLDEVYRTGVPFVGRSVAVELRRSPDTRPEKRYVDVVYQPISGPTGDRAGIFVEGYDVTDRVVAEEQQRLLLHELNHRVKNLFAIFSGMVRVTARDAESAREMAETLQGRLDALAAANDLIRPGVTGDSAGFARTDLSTLIRTVAAPHLADGQSLVVVGPAVDVGLQSLTSLALLFHETATNAAKYGALSVPNGRVEVEWAAADGRLSLAWRERGGPEVTAPPARTGFGSVLVRRSVEGQLQGTLDFHWRPEGLEVRVDLPSDLLAG